MTRHTARLEALERAEGGPMQLLVFQQDSSDPEKYHQGDRTYTLEQVRAIGADAGKQVILIDYETNWRGPEDGKFIQLEWPDDKPAESE